ncbi:MAG: preprotein translocase subunit SecG [Bacteroidota bacterium]|jgi:preprotein translocase subunit SecG
MSALISVLIIICSILLILVVLVQNSKGGGLASSFSSSNQVMGVKRTSELIEKITWALIIAIVVLCIAASFTLKGGSSSNLNDTELREKINGAPAAQQQPVAPAAAPAQQPAAAPANEAPAN